VVKCQVTAWHPDSKQEAQDVDENHSLLADPSHRLYADVVWLAVPFLMCIQVMAPALRSGSFPLVHR